MIVHFTAMSENGLTLVSRDVSEKELVDGFKYSVSEDKTIWVPEWGLYEDYDLAVNQFHRLASDIGCEVSLPH